MDWSCLACGSLCPDTHQFCGQCGARRTAQGGGTGEVDDVLRALVGEQLRAELVEHGGRLPEERRLVSALFADLSGFTSLAGRLDPETLAMVVDPILAGLVRIVKRGEGHVGAFAGDALLCYFGAPVAHEDDAARAVRCAHEMLEEFPALLAVAPKQAAELTLRIGVDTGAVMARLVAGDIKTDYNILGNSVNMSQRLQSNAPPGALVVGETTYRLTRDDFDYEDIGPLQVKGRAEPLPAYLLLGPRDRNVLRRTAHSARVHGREAELAAIADAETPGPVRGLAVVADAGTGKSRLLQEARTRSSRPWYEGGCSPQHKDRSWRPWIGALTPLANRPLSDGLKILFGRDLDEDLEALPPAVRRDVVARDVAAALREAAPCVVVLEDLHWADQPSLDLLDDVLFEAGDADVLVVASSREKVPATAELSLLELGPLGASDVATLLADLLRGDPPEDLVEEVVRRSGGNPLYVGELAFALRDRGLVSLVEGDVLVTAATGLAQALDLVPDSVEGLIGARIDALPAAQERALTIAAALGFPVDERLVGEVTAELAEPSGEVPGAMAGLADARMIEDGDFVHALVMSTAYSRTTRARRRQIHLAAAAVGPRHVSDDELPGYLARHLYLAGAGARALAALEHATEHALSKGAHEEALLHLYRDLELRRDNDVEPERRALLPQRLVATGELLDLLGRYAEAEPIFREAIELGAGPVAYRGLAGCLRRLGRFDEVATAVDRALDLPALTPALRSQLREEKAAALTTQGRYDEALSSLDPQASGAARARSDLVRAYCLTEQADLAGAEELVVNAVRTLSDADDGPGSARGWRQLGMVLHKAGQLPAAVDALENGLRTARACGATEEVLACLTNLSDLALTSHDWEVAVRYAGDAVRQSDRMRHTFGRAVTRNNLAYGLIQLDQAPSAIAVSDQAIAIAREHHLTGVEGSFLATRGAARLVSGDLEGAQADAEASLELVAGSEYVDETLDLLRAVAAERAHSRARPGALS